MDNNEKTADVTVPDQNKPLFFVVMIGVNEQAAVGIYILSIYQVLPQRDFSMDTHLTAVRIQLRHDGGQN